MLKIDNTDSNQYKIIYHFFIENGKILVISILLGITTLVSCCYWYINNKNSSSVIASNTWQSINTDLDGYANPLQLNNALHFANSNNNNYSVFTFLGLARQYVERSDFKAAQVYLQKALNQTHDANLKSIINLRLARIYLQQKNVDKALQILDNIKANGWNALAEDARGDAQLIKGNEQAARSSYEKALQFGAPQVFIRMKMNNLSN